MSPKLLYDLEEWIVAKEGHSRARDLLLLAYCGVRRAILGRRSRDHETPDVAFWSQAVTAERRNILSLLSAVDNTPQQIYSPIVLVMLLFGMMYEQFISVMMCFEVGACSEVHEPTETPTFPRPLRMAFGT